MALMHDLWSRYGKLRADEIPDALDVVHDAGDELTGLRVVEDPDR